MSAIGTADLENKLAECVSGSGSNSLDADGVLGLIEEGLVSANLLLELNKGQQQELHAAILTLYSRGERLSHRHRQELHRPVEAYRLLLDGLLFAAKLESSCVYNEMLCKLIHSLLTCEFEGNQDYHATHGGAALLKSLRTLTDRTLLVHESLAGLTPDSDRTYGPALWQALLVLSKRQIPGRVSPSPQNCVLFYFESLFSLLSVSANAWRLHFGICNDQFVEHFKPLVEDELNWLLQNEQALLQPCDRHSHRYLFYVVYFIEGNPFDKPWASAQYAKLKPFLHMLLEWYADNDYAEEVVVALGALHNFAVNRSKNASGDALFWLDTCMKAALKFSKYNELQLRFNSYGRAWGAEFVGPECQNYFLSFALEKIERLDERSDSWTELALVLFSMSEHWSNDFILNSRNWVSPKRSMYFGNQLIWLVLMERLSTTLIESVPTYKEKMNFMISEFICHGLRDHAVSMVGDRLPVLKNSDGSKMNYDPHGLFLDFLSRLAVTGQFDEQASDNLFLGCLVAGTNQAHSATTEFHFRLRQCLHSWKTT